MHLANASYRFIHVEKFNKCYDTRMRGEKNGMGEELNKYSKSYHTVHTAQQTHTQIPPSTYIFMNHEIRKKKSVEELALTISKGSYVLKCTHTLKF